MISREVLSKYLEDQISYNKAEEEAASLRGDNGTALVRVGCRLSLESLLTSLPYLEHKTYQTTKTTADKQEKE
jgi:hypothetical protein